MWEKSGRLQCKFLIIFRSSPKIDENVNVKKLINALENKFGELH